MIAVLPIALVLVSNPSMSLQDVLRVAVSEAESPKIALERIEQAKAQARRAWGALLPTARLTGNYSRRAFDVTLSTPQQDEDGNEGPAETVTIRRFNGLAGQAQITSTLFSARSIPDIQAARSNIKEAEGGLKTAKFDLVHEVASAYVDVLVAQAAMDSARRRLEVARDDASAAKARLEAGLVANVDLDRAEIEALTAEVLVARSEETRRISRLRLSLLVGKELDSVELTPVDIKSVELEESELVLEAMTARPEIHVAKAALDEAQDRALAPMLELIPDVGLDATARISNEPGFGNRQEDWIIGINLNWTLYDGGIRYAEAREASAAARIARLQLELLERTIRTEVREGVVALQTVKADLRLALRRRELTRRYAEEVRARSSRGLATAVEAADAAVSAYEAELSAATGEAEVARAIMRLRRALGWWPTESSKGQDTPSSKAG